MTLTVYPSAQDVVSALDWHRIVTQRWFRRKDATYVRIELIDGRPVFRDRSLHGWWLLIHATTKNDSADYQLPVLLTTNPCVRSSVFGTCRKGADTLQIVDGIGDASMLASLLTTCDPEFEHGRVEARFQGDPLQIPDDVSVLSADSTNSLVRIANGHVLKIYRVLDAGGTREVDFLEALAQPRVASVPTLHASVEYRTGTDRRALALLQEWIDGAEDAWSWLTKLLANGPQNITDDVVAMADAVGSVHAGLRRRGTRPWSKTDTKDLLSRVTAGLARAELYIPDDAKLRKMLAHVRDYVEADFDSESGCLQAVHGDLHLGQLLRQNAAGDSVRYYIIDFEGEPLAPPDERCAWHSPLKDVAGMLRSFDYAVGVARKAGAPGDDAVWNVWRAECERTFLARYSIHSDDTKVDTDTLLALFVIEKVLYEIAYEATNRPNWIDVPLGGLSRVVDRLRTLLNQ